MDEEHKELQKSNRNVCILLHACKCGYAAAEHEKICTQSLRSLDSQSPANQHTQA